MEQYFIKFFLHQNGEKSLSLIKVSECPEESKDFPFKVTTYYTSERGDANTNVICNSDHESFMSHYPIQKQLEGCGNCGKAYCVEISQSIFKAIELLFSDLFKSFIELFEKNEKECSKFIEKGDSIFGDFFIYEKNKTSSELKFFEFSDGGLYTSFSLTSYDRDDKALCRHFEYMPRIDINQIPHDLKVMTSGSVNELNDLFNEKRATINETLEYVFNNESEISIDSIMEDFWEEEERKYRNYLEERDNYSSWEDDNNYNSWEDDDDW